MKASLSVRVNHREVFRTDPAKKISMVSDITSFILQELDWSPSGQTEDWTRMVITIDRESF